MSKNDTLADKIAAVEQELAELKAQQAKANVVEFPKARYNKAGACEVAADKAAEDALAAEGYAYDAPKPPAEAPAPVEPLAPEDKKGKK